MDPFIDQVLGPLGALVLAIMILVGGNKGRWWVYGWQYRAVVQEKEEWKQAALRTTHLAEAAASVGEHLVERNKALREGDT